MSRSAAEGRSGRFRAVIALVGLVLAMLALPGLESKASAAASAPALSVGYVDGSTGLTPWSGSAKTNFSGTSATCCLTHGPTNGSSGWDSGALLINNPAASSLTISSVSVDVGGTHFAIWPANQTVPANGNLVMTMTSGFNFDGSDVGSEVCSTNDQVVPTVHVTAGGVTYNYSDTHQILNAQGTDQASCPNDVSEQHAFTPVGQTGSAPLSAPVNTLAPTVVGLAQRSELLSTLPGAWDANPPPSLSEQWQRCTSGTCTNIAGATGGTYTATSADVGSSLRTMWTGTNSVASTAIPSAQTGVVTDGPDISRFGNTNTGGGSNYQQSAEKFGSIFTAPTSGTSTAFRFYARGGGVDQQFVPTIYSTVNGAPGSLLGQGSPITVAKGAAGTWWRAPLSGIPLTAGTNYVLALVSQSTGSVATYLNYDNTTGAGYYNANAFPTPSSSWGTVNKDDSNWSFDLDYTPSGPPPPPSAPANTVPPAISGAAQSGGILTASTGTWTGTTPISYAYQWQSCPAGGGACTSISGAVNQTYVVTAGDVGNSLQVIVTATNSIGSSSATSAPTATVTVPPASGSFGASAPGALSAQPGSGYKFGTVFTASASGTSVDFRAYVSGGSAVQRFTPAVYSVSGGNPAQLLGTGNEFTIAAGQAAGWITSTLTKVTLVAGSSYTLVLVAGDNSNTAHIYYDSVTNAGIWNANAYPTPSTSWGAINREPLSWSFALDYTPSSPPPPPTAPANTAVPTITGTPQQGSVLTASTGTWTGTTPISYAYQWQSCPAGGGGTCTPISGAVNPTYTTVAADVGTTIDVSVTATNTAGNATATSAATATITGPTPPPPPTAPANTAAPTITGTPQQGSVLTASTGTWTGTTPISYAYQWQSCPAGGGTCTPISGAVNPTYTTVAADVGTTIDVSVTATNTAGNATATSAPTATITSPPTSGVIGTNVAGATFAGPGASYKFGSIFAAPASGTSIDFRTYVAGGTVAQRFTPAVYSVSGGNPRPAPCHRHRIRRRCRASRRLGHHDAGQPDGHGQQQLRAGSPRRADEQRCARLLRQRHQRRPLERQRLHDTVQ